jgi:hypothetical protein
LSPPIENSIKSYTRPVSPSDREAVGVVSGCSCEVREIFECPVCGRQTVVLATEPPPTKPFICDIGHRKVEMEQRLPDAYRAEFQSVNWETDLDALQYCEVKAERDDLLAAIREDMERARRRAADTVEPEAFRELETVADRLQALLDRSNLHGSAVPGDAEEKNSPVPKSSSKPLPKTTEQGGGAE